MEIHTKMMCMANLVADGEFGEAQLEELAGLHTQLTETIDFVDNHLVIEEKQSGRND
jgi:hypothetical protein